MSEIAVRVENLGKRYRIGARQTGYKTLRETMSDLARTPLRLFQSLGQPRDPEAEEQEILWALRDVSFEVKPGEVLAVVGRNGAGKSTLLKLLSRITEPTTGSIEIHGRVGSLLEVGTGFHPELTGRENIYLSGAILGMHRTEIERKFEEIVEFAEVSRFVDTPVKRYSSGMYLRLAFSVAAHLDPEILVVDEVLAVGDAQFQKKCLGRMDEVAQDGRTVFFVSHNMSAIQRLCTHGLFLEHGQLIENGPIQNIISRYNAVENGEAVARFNPRNRMGTGWARIQDFRLVDNAGHAISGRPADADLTFDIDLALNDATNTGASLRGLVIEIVLKTDEGQPLMSLMNVDDDGVELPDTGRCRVRMQLPGPTFVPGRYRANIFLGLPYLQHVDEIPDALAFDVLPPQNAWRPYDLYAIRGHVCRKAEWTCEVGTDDLLPDVLGQRQSASTRRFSKTQEERRIF